MIHKLKTLDAPIEKAFATELAGEVANAGNVTYMTVVVRLRRLERKALKNASNKILAIEMKRRIAEQLLQQAIFHSCSIAACRRRLNTLSELGFTNVGRKAHFHLLYARGALERGHRQIARAIATVTASELERARKRDSGLLRDLKKSFARLLSQIDGFG
jgi:hypothetical protein